MVSLKGNVKQIAQKRKIQARLFNVRGVTRLKTSTLHALMGIEKTRCVFVHYFKKCGGDPSVNSSTLLTNREHFEQSSSYEVYLYEYFHSGWIYHHSLISVFNLYCFLLQPLVCAMIRMRQEGCVSLWDEVIASRKYNLSTNGCVSGTLF